jgi:hypothetical protein
MTEPSSGWKAKVANALQAAGVELRRLAARRICKPHLPPSARTGLDSDACARAVSAREQQQGAVRRPAHREVVDIQRAARAEDREHGSARWRPARGQRATVSRWLHSEQTVVLLAAAMASAAVVFELRADVRAPPYLLRVVDPHRAVAACGQKHVAVEGREGDGGHGPRVRLHDGARRKGGARTCVSPNATAPGLAYLEREAGRRREQLQRVRPCGEHVLRTHLLGQRAPSSKRAEPCGGSVCSRSQFQHTSGGT